MLHSSSCSCADYVIAVVQLISANYMGQHIFLEEMTQMESPATFQVQSRLDALGFQHEEHLDRLSRCALMHAAVLTGSHRLLDSTMHARSARPFHAVALDGVGADHHPACQPWSGGGHAARAGGQESCCALHAKACKLRSCRLLLL